jgi:hypothetical protein
MVATVVTVAVKETAETEGMLALAATEMAATAVMEVRTEETEGTAVMVTDQVMEETEAMRVLAASAVRVAVAGMREDMMVLPGLVALNSYPSAVNVVCRRLITPATSCIQTEQTVRQC